LQRAPSRRGCSLLSVECTVCRYIWIR
jgi:hypothetical protein